MGPTPPRVDRERGAPTLDGMLRRLPKWFDSERRLALRRFAGTATFAEHLDRPVRVAHLTDQHVGMVTSMATQQAAIDAINREEPDLVALTGDYVAHSLDYLDELVELLSGIRAPKIGVLGNHDHWTGPDEVRRALRRADVEVLDNANTTITLAGQPVQVVGLDDAYTGNADIERATRGLRSDIATLGLSHIGEEADELWNAGVSLVLSGHTHSGQITLAGMNRVTLGTLGGHRYVHGLYGCRRQERAPGALYVSAGVGAAVFGVRLGDRGRPEVALFELGHEPGAIDDEHHAEQVAHAGRPVSEKTRRKRAERAARLRAKRSGEGRGRG